MIVSKPGGIEVMIRVIPRAGTSEIAGTRNGALLVRLSSPPVGGAANAELIAWLARALGVPRRGIAILSGERGRLKRVRIDGVSAADAKACFGV
jgi:uncharacterized protein (TIGR00251 family)